MGYHYQHYFEEKIWTGVVKAPPGAGELLAGAGLRWEGPFDLTLVLWDADGPAATASFRDKIIKGVAVRPNLRGTGTGRKIVGRTIARQRTRGIVHTVVYTSPAAAPFFRVMGFGEIGRAEPWTVQLETGFGSFDQYLGRLRKTVPPGAVAAIVYENLSAERIRTLITLSGSTPVLLFLAGGRAALETSSPQLILIEGEDYFRPYESFPSYYLSDPTEAPRAWAVLQAHLLLKASAALSLAGVILMENAAIYNREARPLFHAAGLSCLEEKIS